MNHALSQKTKLIAYFITGVSFSIGSLIAVNLHDLTHIKCGAAGECFGASESLNQFSLLPFWIILPGCLTLALLLTSALMYLLTRRKNPATETTSYQLFDAQLLNKYFSWSFLISLGLALSCSAAAYWIINQG